MASGESVEQLLRSATGSTGEAAAAVYAKWASLSMGNDDNLTRLVFRKLTANAKGTQIRSSLLETIKAGGAVGESVEECLRKSGLTGWS